MADVKWIKIVTDIFDDEKIQLIENLPDADTLIIIWFKLLCLAGKTNNNGVFLLSGKMPYTDEMLSIIFRRPLASVRLALETFEKLGMIEKYDDVITVPNWSKHQTLDKLEKKNEYMREYMRDYRQKQKQIACKTNVKDSRKTNVSNSRKTNVSNLRKANVSSLDKIRLDKDIDKDIDKINQIDTIQRDHQTIELDREDILATWNELAAYGVSPIKAIGPKREEMLKACIERYGPTSFTEIVEQIKSSDYLLGKADRELTVSFEWVIDIDNYGKVLEGFYKNKAKTRRAINFCPETDEPPVDFEDLERRLLDN